MLTVKTYFCKQAQLSFCYQIEVDGVKTTHSFVMESNNTCVVVDPAKQEAIENSKYFKSGWLTIKSESEATESDIYSYNKAKLKEKKIIDLSINDPEKSLKVQETAQMKVEDEKIIDPTVELDKEVETELQNKTDENVNVELATAVSPYANITSIQQAKDVLRGEPYNVPFQQLNTPANILKKAEEIGVVFPNL